VSFGFRSKGIDQEPGEEPPYGGSQRQEPPVITLFGEPRLVMNPPFKEEILGLIHQESEDLGGNNSYDTQKERVYEKTRVFFLQIFS
jgi:hypothetical protein